LIESGSNNCYARGAGLAIASAVQGRGRDSAKGPTGKIITELPSALPLHPHVALGSVEAHAVGVAVIPRRI